MKKLVVLFFAVVAVFSFYGSPANSIVVEYSYPALNFYPDGTTPTSSDSPGTLSILVFHNSDDQSVDFIKTITLSVNGNEVGRADFERQSYMYGERTDFKVMINSNDKIEVTAVANSGEVTKYESPSAQAAPESDDANDM